MSSWRLLRGFVALASAVGIVTMLALGAITVLQGSAGRPGLGPAVPSDFPPLVIPSNALRDTATSDATGAVYLLPKGTDVEQLDAWYAANMPPVDFRGLRFLTDFYDQGLGHDWYWCSADPAYTLDVSPSQDDAGHRAIVAVARQPIAQSLQGRC